MARLQGKSALVTGGAAGIGAALARLFCAEGAAVTLVDRDVDALRQTCKAIAAELPQARLAHFAADVSDAAQADNAVAAALSAHGRLDVLINNAAMRNNAAVADATPAEWQAVVAVNLMGTAHYCRAALPALRASGRGSIVNVSSCYAVTGRKGMGLYDATKAGMLALTRTLAHEEAAHGVRVNAVCPGSTLTDFHLNKAKAAGKAVEQLRDERQTTSLLGRWADPQEIAWPILWLASDEASFITGTTLMVDGGLHTM
ncbi:MAG: short-chain dehydrogenase [Ramlibacter sp.]|nr:short-chain dehydrogenase [Ramlibacter sp.]